MKHDNCYIDGMSTLSRFGCWVTRGGYKDLLAFPEMEEPEHNDWPEEDGIEADLSAPRLKAKEMTVTFLSGSHTGATDLIAYLSEPGGHTLRVPSLGREWTVRLVEQPAGRMYMANTEFSVKLAQDLPVRPRDGSLPSPGLPVYNSGYLLDGTPLSAYGVSVLEAREEVLKAPTVKKNLERTVSTEDGRIYDIDHLRFQHKEVRFKCLLNTARMENFWDCYDALLTALVAPGERDLYAPPAGKSYPCYYKSMAGVRLHRISGPVTMEFTLTMVFTMFRLYETDYFLATEEGDWIVTEDEEFFIDMK